MQALREDEKNDLWPSVKANDFGPFSFTYYYTLTLLLIDSPACVLLLRPDSMVLRWHRACAQSVNLYI